MSKPLHLPDVTIKGFRGIDDLTIPRLGRVTLLAGKNGVGKTTVLEAVRVFAARGSSSALLDVLTNREEVDWVADDDRNSWLGEVDYTSLFYGRSTCGTPCVAIGSESEPVRIETVSLEDEVPSLMNMADPVDGLSVSFRNKRHIHWDVSEKRLRLFHHSQPLPKNDKPDPEIPCETIGPGTLSAIKIARFWESVALTDQEDQAERSLELVLDQAIIGLAVVGDRENNRRTIVRLKNQDKPVPLRSLGDGAIRLFGVSLALANSKGGLLLIDEAENGIHHTVQYDLWRMILQTAQSNDVQVLATTHSWDCVRGFAYAAAEFEDGEGMLVRLDRDDRGLRAVEYSKEGLLTAAEQSIEVR